MTKKRKRLEEDEDDVDSSILQIDENRLEYEWINQPTLVFKYAKKLADARFKFDEAKAELEVTEADIANTIRKAPELYDLKKVTEGAVKETIPLQSEYKAAVQELNKAKHTVEVYAAVVSALDNRKKALEKLVDLWMANYFSTPRAPNREASDKMEEQSKRDVRTKMKKRLKKDDDDED